MGVGEAAVERAFCVVVVRFGNVVRHPFFFCVVDHPPRCGERYSLPESQPVYFWIELGPVYSAGRRLREDGEHLPLYVIAHPVCEVPVARAEAGFRVVKHRHIGRFPEVREREQRSYPVYRFLFVFFFARESVRVDTGDRGVSRGEQICGMKRCFPEVSAFGPDAAIAGINGF